MLARLARVVTYGCAMTTLLACPRPVAAEEAAASPALATEGIRFVVHEIRGTPKIGPTGTAPYDPKAGWKPVSVGDTIVRGASLFTGLGGAVKLVLEPAEPPTIIMVEGGTLCSFDELQKSDNAAITRLGLAYGAIRAGVAETGAPSDLQIRSPVATLSKRGTWDFRLEVERGTGRFQMSLADRGLVEALHHKTGLRRQIHPGQFVNQVMSRWVETVRFNRQVASKDIFGLKGTDLWFNTNQSNGLGITTPGGDLVGILNSTGRNGRDLVGQGGLFGALGTGQANGSQSLLLGQALRDRGTGGGIIRRPDGDFGIGFGSVPVQGVNHRLKRLK